MTELEDTKRTNARDTFRKNGVCITTGCACELRHDCRECNVPLAIGQIEIASALKAHRCGCEERGGKEE